MSFLNIIRERLSQRSAEPPGPIEESGSMLFSVKMSACPAITLQQQLVFIQCLMSSLLSLFRLAVDMPGLKPPQNGLKPQGGTGTALEQR